MEHFSRNQLKEDLALNLTAVLTRLKHIFGPHAATAVLPGITEKTFSVSPEGLTVDGLPVTYQFLKLYDYVISNEWDLFGHRHHADDVYLDTKSFMDWLGTIDEYFGDLLATERCQHLVEVACARFKFDEKLQFSLRDDCLTLEEVALLANMSEASVRNAASRGEFKTEELDGVKHVCDYEDLANWLQSRRNYRPTRIFDSIDDIDKREFSSLGDFTIFLQERMAEIGLPASTFKKEVGWDVNRFADVPPMSSGGLERFDVEEWVVIAELLEVDRRWLLTRMLQVFTFSLDITVQEDLIWQMWEETRSAEEKGTILVPVAGDGSVFHPGLRRRKGYQIGAKGSEDYIEDYFSALRALRGMEPPYWRRPSETTGTFGIVKGMSWKPISKRELVKEINALSKEESK